jgi:superfamily I DNA/RNA helicase
MMFSRGHPGLFRRGHSNINRPRFQRPRQLSRRTDPGPAEATSAEAVPPHLDEDYLVLSTIHSAKGQEWDAVFRAQRD